MPGLDFSGLWVSVFTIIVKVIEYKRKKKLSMNLENVMIIIISFLFRSILLSSFLFFAPLPMAFSRLLLIS